MISRIKESLEADLQDEAQNQYPAAEGAAPTIFMPRTNVQLLRWTDLTMLFSKQPWVQWDALNVLAYEEPDDVASVSLTGWLRSIRSFGAKIGGSVAVDVLSRYVFAVRQLGFHLNTLANRFHVTVDRSVLEAGIDVFATDGRSPFVNFRNVMLTQYGGIGADDETLNGIISVVEFLFGELTETLSYRVYNTASGGWGDLLPEDQTRRYFRFHFFLMLVQFTQLFKQRIALNSTPDDARIHAALAREALNVDNLCMIMMVFWIAAPLAYNYGIVDLNFDYRNPHAQTEVAVEEE